MKPLLTHPLSEIVLLAILITASRGAGAHPFSALVQLLPDDPPVGCGKAHALRENFNAQAAVEEWQREYKSQVAGGQREAIEDTDLLHIDLEIEIVPGGSPNIIGTNTMTLRSNVDGLSVFTFRLRDQYAIANPTINGSTPVAVAGLSATTRQATLDRAYNLGEEFTLTIPYSGVSQSAGFGSIEFTSHGPQGDPIVASLSEPYYAYSWWPAKDGDFGLPGDNSDKFSADISILSPDTMITASNGALMGVDPLPGGRHRYRWSTTYSIATYLVAISSTNYNQWTQMYTPLGGGAMPVLFYIYPEVDTPSNRNAWGKVVNMLTVLRDFYGEYPFVEEKYGIYNFPFGGGMEHQTFTGQGSTAFGEGITAHELGHQWWGDAVTCETWSDIWLNEGFATFTECLWEEYKTGMQNPSAYFSCMQGKKPSAVNNSVYVPPAETNSVSRIFSSTYSYRKASWVLHMLRGLVGDSTFFDILAAHRAAHEGSAATTDEFAAVASDTYGQDLTWFFSQWVYLIGAPAYAYGWQTIHVAGQDYLLARIQQTHTESTSNWPAVFTMPIDLVATVGGFPQTETVWNHVRTQWFVIPIGAPATAMQFDPNQWVLRTAASLATYVPGPPAIVATSPAPGADLDIGMNIDEISIYFHTNVNANVNLFSLVGQNTGVRSFQLISGSNVNPVVLQLDQPLVADNYTLTVSSAVTAANSGMFLDGEIADPADPSSLPSGDGVPGGSALIRFTISGSLLPGPASVVAAGGRYLQFDPGAGTDPLTLRVAPSCPGAAVQYVAAPSGPNNVAGLVADRFDAAYLTPAQWGNPIRLTGIDIIPSTNYAVQVDFGTPGDPQLRAPVNESTWVWGNCDNAGIVELADLLCVLFSYSGNYSYCSLFATDLGGNDPDQLVDITDVIAMLSAYANASYAGPSPCP